MGILDDRYKTRARAELEKDIVALENRKDFNSIEEMRNFMQQGEVIRERINFAVRLQLIDILKQQELADRLQTLLFAKLKIERLATFREQVINPNDDVTTALERLFDIRKTEKESLDKWKKEISQVREGSKLDKSVQSHMQPQKNNADERQR